MRRPGAGLVVWLLALSHARAEEVVETYDDGTVKTMYTIDEQGRKNGTYVAHWPNGKVARRAFFVKDTLEGSERTFDEKGRARTQVLYRNGLLHGRFLGWDGEGKPAVVATYADGNLDGKRELYRAGKQVSTQVWRHGNLHLLEGVRVFPRSQEDIRRVIAQILDGDATDKNDIQAPESPRADAAAGTDRASALRRLMAYRYLCGLPYAELVLGEQENRYATAAAMICSKLGHLTHDPPNPGLSEADYTAGALGAKSCNLGYGTAAESIDGYMDDSDPTNIARLGHRRWCLNPPLRITGFGTAAGADGSMYTAMWATDASGGKTAEIEAVCYPPGGWVPADFFGPSHAWSVSFPAGRISRAATAAIKVAVYELEGDYARAETPLGTDYFRVSEDHFGLPVCVVFRPAGIRTEPGAAYWVEVSGLDPSSPKSSGGWLRYVVSFAPCVRAAEDAAEGPDEGVAK